MTELTLFFQSLKKKFSQFCKRIYKRDSASEDIIGIRTIFKPQRKYEVVIWSMYYDSALNVFYTVGR